MKMPERETQPSTRSTRSGLPAEGGAPGAAVSPEGGVSNPKGSARRGVLCAKCEHLNPPGLSRCEHCEAHLYITCHACSHSNQRVHSRCSKCGYELHRPLHRRLIKKWLKGKRGAMILQIILLIVAVFGAYKLVIRLAN